MALPSLQHQIAVQQMFHAARERNSAHFLLVLAAVLVALIAVQVWLGVSFVPSRQRSDYGCGSDYYFPKRADGRPVFWVCIIAQAALAGVFAIMAAHLLSEARSLMP